MRYQPTNIQESIQKCRTVVWSPCTLSFLAAKIKLYPLLHFTMTYWSTAIRWFFLDLPHAPSRCDGDVGRSSLHWRFCTNTCLSLVFVHHQQQQTLSSQSCAGARRTLRLCLQPARTFVFFSSTVFAVFSTPYHHFPTRGQLFSTPPPNFLYLPYYTATRTRKPVTRMPDATMMEA